MADRLYRFLAEDHDRLATLLTELEQVDDIASDPRYIEFRQGLLRHIAMEEKVLLPFARERNAGVPLSVAARIRLDHGALAALLAPTPTAPIMATIRRILQAHNPIEEDRGGLYETIEGLAGTDLETLLDRVHSVREVKVAPHSDSPRALDSMREAVRRAGYGLGS